MLCNGIDTDRLETFARSVVTAPDAATISTQVDTRWHTSYRTQASTTTFRLGSEPIPRATTLPLDLPGALGGDDRGATPGELILAALGSCVAQAFVEEAALVGAEIGSLLVSADARLDLRGTLGVAGTRPGLSRIYLDVEVESTAEAGAIDDLLTAALRRSPVADTLGATVQIDAELRQAPVG